MHDQNQPVIVPLLVMPSLFLGAIAGWFQLRRRRITWQDKPRVGGFLHGIIEVIVGLVSGFLGLALSIPEDRFLPVAVPAILLAGTYGVCPGAWLSCKDSPGQPSWDVSIL